jgi:hypothetical protein
MWLQQSDPIFNMRVDAMRTAFNFEPKYITMLTGKTGPKELGLLL